jgi:hypothetical protein
MLSLHAAQHGLPRARAFRKPDSLRRVPRWVAPEKIGFDDRTTESIADWNTTFGAVYSLWLNSGAYEAWSESELRSIDSAINRDGLAVREALSRYVPTTYLWFWNGSRPISCPSCGSENLSEQGQLLVCLRCSVSVSEHPHGEPDGGLDTSSPVC